MHIYDYVKQIISGNFVGKEMIWCERYYWTRQCLQKKGNIENIVWVELNGEWWMINLKSVKMRLAMSSYYLLYLKMLITDIAGRVLAL